MLVASNKLASISRLSGGYTFILPCPHQKLSRIKMSPGFHWNMNEFFHSKRLMIFSSLDDSTGLSSLDTLTSRVPNCIFFISLPAANGKIMLKAEKRWKRDRGKLNIRRHWYRYASCIIRTGQYSKFVCSTGSPDFGWTIVDGSETAVSNPEPVHLYEIPSASNSQLISSLVFPLVHWAFPSL